MVSHTNPPNRYGQEAGIKLGLSEVQVLTPNFGYHTIVAINEEISRKDAPLSLAEAFEKYHGLNNIQVEAIKELGLNRTQVLTSNFGYHTINAIRDILKRTPELSAGEAFAMIRNKSLSDTNKFVTSYLSATKKAQKPIGEMDLIRVVVNPGRGFGHQRAAITLMQKLREMGFKGTFDIQCRENQKTYTNNQPYVSSQLISMIPEFESSQPNEEGVRAVAGLGAVKISSLPHDMTNRGNLELPMADLAVCAADDFSITGLDKKASTFNAPSYIGLQPTDWHQGSCFVTDQDGVVTELPPASEMRLSSMAASQSPDISSIILSETEERIISIAQGSKFNSQLVYGLYPEMKHDKEPNGMKESGNLDEAVEMQRIVEAHLLLNPKTGKPSIILLPQKVALDDDFITRVKGRNEHIHFVDLTEHGANIEEYRDGDVVVAYTGALQQTVFDHLMLKGTTFPPVIEGCNSRETCEAAGRPFIHGSGKQDPLKRYDVESSSKQDLHTRASLCLEKGDMSNVSQLVQYMEECRTSDPGIMAYHQERRGAFLSREDATEKALKALGIEYGGQSQENDTRNNLSDKPLEGAGQETPGRPPATNGRRIKPNALGRLFLGEAPSAPCP